MGQGQTNFSGIGIGEGSAAETLVNEVLNGTATIDPASIAAGATATASITVTSAALGDYVIIAPPYSLQGLVATAYVSAADTVTAVLYNPTAAAIDLASGSWKAKVLS